MLPGGIDIKAACRSTLFQIEADKGHETELDALLVTVKQLPLLDDNAFGPKGPSKDAPKMRAWCDANGKITRIATASSERFLIRRKGDLDTLKDHMALACKEVLQRNAMAFCTALKDGIHKVLTTFQGKAGPSPPELGEDLTAAERDGKHKQWLDSVVRMRQSGLAAARACSARTLADIGATGLALGNTLHAAEVQLADRRALVDDVLHAGVRPLTRLLLAITQPDLSTASTWQVEKVTSWLGKPLDFDMLGVAQTQQVAIDLSGCHGALKNLLGQTVRGHLANSIKPLASVICKLKEYMASEAPAGTFALFTEVSAETVCLGRDELKRTLTGVATLKNSYLPLLGVDSQLTVLAASVDGVDAPIYVALIAPGVSILASALLAMSSHCASSDAMLGSLLEENTFREALRASRMAAQSLQDMCNGMLPDNHPKKAFGPALVGAGNKQAMALFEAGTDKVMAVLTASVNKLDNLLKDSAEGLNFARLYDVEAVDCEALYNATQTTACRTLHKQWRELECMLRLPETLLPLLKDVRCSQRVGDTIGAAKQLISEKVPGIKQRVAECIAIQAACRNLKAGEARTSLITVAKSMFRAGSYGPLSPKLDLFVEAVFKTAQSTERDAN